ncbi:hypothetical protein [Undibacterium sp. RuTC16W]|uniref:hypothetical protein n=1 Tax=Undibacterium sp. RuTC16W TaxID=3413048 RepID=UPI003BF11AF4
MSAMLVTWREDQFEVNIKIKLRTGVTKHCRMLLYCKSPAPLIASKEDGLQYLRGLQYVSTRMRLTVSFMSNLPQKKDKNRENDLNKIKILLFCDIGPDYI